MPACSSPLSAAPLPLIQIRHGFAADCHGLRLTIEVDADGWMAKVMELPGGRTLYAARRCSQASAKTAAAEFALWSAGAGGTESPEAAARHLSWREYW